MVIDGVTQPNKHFTGLNPHVIPIFPSELPILHGKCHFFPSSITMFGENDLEFISP